MIVVNEKYRSQKVWLFFFTLIFCFFTNTIVQYLSYGIIFCYVMMRFCKYRALKIEKYRARNVLFAIGGYTLLVLWICLTKPYAYGVVEDSGTFIAVLKLLVIGLLLGIDIDSKDRVIQILIAYVEALAIMCVVILLTSSPSTYFTIGFGGITQQFRNTIANSVFFGIALICYLKQYIYINKFQLFFVLFLITGLLTGSRRGIIQLVLLLLAYGITANGLRKKFKIFLLICAIGIVMAMVVSSTPFLKDDFLPRVISMFNTSIDDSSASKDMSTIGRNLYRSIGMYMFTRRPITGYGMDGFYLFLKDNPYTFSTYRLNAVYSHCNYVELLADFGIIGFLCFYSMHFKLIIRCIKNYKENLFSRITLIIIAITLVLDYGGISYNSFFAMYMYYLLLYGVAYGMNEI